MRYSSSQKYKIKDDTPISFVGWSLIVPKGTICKGTGHGFFYCAAQPDWIANAELRNQAKKPHSLFRHDATYSYAWVPQHHVEEV